MFPIGIAGRMHLSSAFVQSVQLTLGNPNMQPAVFLSHTWVPLQRRRFGHGTKWTWLMPVFGSVGAGFYDAQQEQVEHVQVGYQKRMQSTSTWIGSVSPQAYWSRDVNLWNRPSLQIRLYIWWEAMVELHHSEGWLVVCWSNSCPWTRADWSWLLMIQTLISTIWILAHGRIASSWVWRVQSARLPSLIKFHG